MHFNTAVVVFCSSIFLFCFLVVLYEFFISYLPVSFLANALSIFLTHSPRIFWEVAFEMKIFLQHDRVRCIFPSVKYEIQNARRRRGKEKYAKEYIYVFERRTFCYYSPFCFKCHAYFLHYFSALITK